MMSVDKIRRLFGGAKVTTTPKRDEAVFEKIRMAYAEAAKDRAVPCAESTARSIMKRPIVRVALAAAVIVVVGLGLHGIGGGTPAFADIVKPILAAQTAVFKVITTTSDGQVFTTEEGQFMHPGLARYTLRTGDKPDIETITIRDYVKGRSLALSPSDKVAIAFEITNRSGELDPRRINAFKELRDRILAAQKNPDEGVTYLGESRIKGRKVVGYRLAEGYRRTTIWADVETLLPFQIEHLRGHRGGSPKTETMTDIRFNVPLDPADFDTRVPPGYSIELMQMDESPATEADVVAMLRIWTEAADGAFPASLTRARVEDLKEIAATDKSPGLISASDLRDPAYRRRMQIRMATWRASGFVRRLPEEADWRYVGADATLGDAATPVFWYRPEGSETYRVIYADLSLRDVAPEVVAAFQNSSDR